MSQTKLQKNPADNRISGEERKAGGVSFLCDRPEFVQVFKKKKKDGEKK